MLSGIHPDASSPLRRAVGLRRHCALGGRVVTTWCISPLGRAILCPIHDKALAAPMSGWLTATVMVGKWMLV
ncbi:MAG TPA: hypothetical protein VIZ30_12560, partial [Pseudomonadales bacterium]